MTMPPLPLSLFLLGSPPTVSPPLASSRLPPAGGFTRLTLVPKDKWTSKAAHAERAFWYSCWSAGREACSGADKDKASGGRCYDDGDGSRFGTTVTIPRVVPDGEYVLGYAWYGGLGDGFTESFFGDCTLEGRETSGGGGGRTAGFRRAWHVYFSVWQDEHTEAAGTADRPRERQSRGTCVARHSWWRSALCQGAMFSPVHL